VSIGESAELLLTIENAGGSPLAVSDIRTDQPPFSVAGDTVFQLDPGVTRTVVVRFAPPNEGRFQATLSIASNDPHRPTSQVALAGIGEIAPVEDPHIVLDLKRLNFGMVPVGGSAQRNSTVKNRGKAPLAVYRMHVEPSVFRVAGDMAFTVAPLASHTVVVEYKPEADVAHQGRLTFSSNDPLQPDVSVTLLGSGTRCFVTTAAYDSKMQRDVRTVRNLRDESLIHSQVGRVMVSTYYRWNHAASDLIAGSRLGRMIGRCILWPIVLLARFAARSNREPH